MGKTEMNASYGRPSAAATFRKMHESGCFILPNPWDVGSAVVLHSLGFQALATSSAGLAFTLGKPDDVGSLSVGEVLEHVRQLSAATPLPVNVDFQDGYASEPEGVAANVALCVEAGAAGLSIEDATGSTQAPLYDLSLAVERIRAARSAIDGSGVPTVLTARCEAWLVGHPQPLSTALERLTAYAEAGADCLFAPGVREPEHIAAIVQAVSPRPVNVLVGAPSPVLTLSRLKDLGVRRISVGSALARVAWSAFLSAARSIAATGTFDGLGGATPFAELNNLFGKPR